MIPRFFPGLFGFLLVAATPAQSLVSGRVLTERWPGAGEMKMLGGVSAFATADGAGHETRAFRTWETDPAGWFRLSCGAGNHTLTFTDPGGYVRPVVRTNVWLAAGEKIDGFAISPRLDFAEFSDGEWDAKPAVACFQTFAARGKSVTHVAFKLATDGVDGPGPAGQDFVLSVHRQGAGTPDTWPQVGPARVVVQVDCGGPKNMAFSAGWDSGEVPLEPGTTYAVRLRAAQPGGAVQAFWRKTGDAPGAAGDCFRVAADGAGWTGHRLWMAIATDGDGLLVPYNKNVHREYGEFAGFARKWSQTYVAQGRSLAAVALYAACGGTQPPLGRQHLTVRVRRGGPGGPAVGIDKIAAGTGIYTGDASWGKFVAAFAPGEVPLEPGTRYALEFETMETPESLRGFINIKGMVSDENPGFNPYRKSPPDTYEAGEAFKDGVVANCDLDLQIAEYEFAAKDWPAAVEPKNFLSNGGFETIGAEGVPSDWTWHATAPDSRIKCLTGGADPAARSVRVDAPGGKKCGGQLVQVVGGLDHHAACRLSGRVRSTWARDFEHEVSVGLDPTGQTADPSARTIVWQVVAESSGRSEDFVTAPLRPDKDAMSVWLVVRSDWTNDAYAPFQVDWAGISLRAVNSGVPGQ